MGRRAIAGRLGVLGCGFAALMAVGCAAGAPREPVAAVDRQSRPPVTDGIGHGEPLPPGTVVELRFAWPVGLIGRYESKWQQEGRASSSGTVRGRTSVREAADGLLITDDVDSVEGSGVLQRLASMSPNFVVSPEGDFQRVVGIVEHQRKVQAMVEEVLDQPETDPAARDKAIGMLQPLLTKEALTAEVANAWAMGVGFWAGADLEAGETFSFTDSSHTPLAPEQQVEMKVSFGIRGGSRCSRDGEERACVVLELEQRPTERGREQALAAARAVMRKALGDDAGTIDTAELEFDQVLRVVLLAEPATLIPHRMHIANERKLQIQQGSKSESRNEAGRVDVVFSYP